MCPARSLSADVLRESVKAHFSKDGPVTLLRECPGTYGIVFILQNPPTSAPSEFAVKTLTFRDSRTGLSPESLFFREMRIGLSLPHHHNVLRPTSLELIRLVKAVANGALVPTSDTLPAMVMRRAHFTAKEWMARHDAHSLEEKLYVLLGAINGLAWIVTNGFDGHGDVKPENILIRDAEEDFRLSRDPSARYFRWIARIADFGWMDIWKDLSGVVNTRRTLREYCAPERFDGHFEPGKSDVFSWGVVASELLTGKHPSGARNAHNLKEEKYLEWAKGGRRNVEVPDNDLVHNLIVDTLHKDHTMRPTATEVVDRLAKIMESLFHIDAHEVIGAFNQQAIEMRSVKDTAWLADQLLNVAGMKERKEQMGRLESVAMSGQPGVDNLRNVVNWLESTRIYLRYLGSEYEPTERVPRIVGLLLDFIERNMDAIDLRTEYFGDISDDLLIYVNPRTLLGELGVDVIQSIRRVNLRLPSDVEEIVDRFLDTWDRLRPAKIISLDSYRIVRALGN